MLTTAQPNTTLPTGSRRVRVELAERSYDVLIGPGLLDQIGALSRASLRRPSTRAFIAADEHLPISTVDHAAASLYASGLTVTATRVKAHEQHKTLAAMEKLLVQIAATRHERWDPIIALGGGIVGDVTGFAAAVYRRGVPVIQCPTTLLSMVDASVGGKTGVNLEIAPHHPHHTPAQAALHHHAGSLKKNLLGAFHQPHLVIADVAALASLPQRVFRAGLAECVKHGLIAAHAGDPGLFAWTAANSSKILARDLAVLTELVARNVAVKAAIVAGDEREEASDATGNAPRALLNLGHTFGHAIETIHHLSPNDSAADAPLNHGEAISLGIVAACAAASHLKLASPALSAEVAALLKAFGLPTSVRQLPTTQELHALMLHDKKTSGGRITLVLPTGNASATLVADPANEAIVAGWKSLEHPIG